MKKIFLICLLSVCVFGVSAQLVVTVLQPQFIGQKAIVPLAITNNLSQKVESARALCFLINNQGKIVGESAKWVVGGAQNRPALEPKAGTAFNFVLNTSQPLVATNLTTRVTFSRLILDGGQAADPNKDIQIQNANQ